ncbi:DUF1848 domain-containing protein [Butyrivibrio sp. MB2005]|uniref:DUF1848 domain-containing protein n=1 Tax=Butyrivibrio sp. MB2005 TaxID=1280678 RepID=UPI00042773FD|nr:DUF1848 domain-containing protein [Butyrivibrio sp. MB2005]
MILNTGQRTDIPAFYPKWLANRIKEGFVCVRNPYNPVQVSRYVINPEVVDAIGFCSKNPEPFFPYLDLVKDFGQFWYVTITPYGKDIEPMVPDKERVIESFKFLSGKVGTKAIGWRYDPIFVSDKYTIDYHLKAFEKMASSLEGYTEIVVISFIDLYEKVKRNFPEVRAVSENDKLFLGKEIIRIAREHGMLVKPCAEGDFLEKYGADCRGCMTIADYERAIGNKLNAPKHKGARSECACYLSGDIGAYDTCGHLCRYCYANNDVSLVKTNMKNHDPDSPFLIGNYRPDDKINDVAQKSWINGQMSIFDFV